MTFQYKKINKYEKKIKAIPSGRHGLGSFIGLVTEDIYLHFYEEDSIEYVCIVKLPSYLVCTTEKNITPCFGSLTGTICKGTKVTVEATDFFMSSLMDTLHSDIITLLGEAKTEPIGMYHLPLYGTSNRTYKGINMFFAISGDYYPTPHNPHANIVAAHNKLNARRTMWADIQGKYFIMS